MSTSTNLKTADTQIDPNLDPYEDRKDHAVVDPFVRADDPLVIPTEPIGSIPRPAHHIEAVSRNEIDDPDLKPIFEQAVRDTVERFEATGSPVIADGEQRKHHNFWTYSVHGMSNMAPDGFAQLGTTDDCGFAPFSDDTSTSRDTVFEKIRMRVAGTALASAVLRGRHAG